MVIGLSSYFKKQRKAKEEEASSNIMKKSSLSVKRKTPARGKQQRCRNADKKQKKVKVVRVNFISDNGKQFRLN